MKRNIIVSLSFLLLLGACKKDPANTADKVGISRVTRFPDFHMNGSQYNSIVLNDHFADPGVTATENGNPLTLTIDGAVDSSEVGVYNITYSATNHDGFAGSVTRTIAVLPSPEQAGVNIAGKYQNVGSFPYTAQMQKLAPGLYVVDNIWGGSSAAVIPSYVITVNGQNLVVPANALSGSYGTVVGSGVLDATGTATYVLQLPDLGVGNTTKKWKKL